MKHTAHINYQYDPVNQRLFIYDTGRLLGGFKGASAEHQFSKLLDTDVNINITAMKNETERKVQVRRLRAIWIKQGVDKYRESILEAYDVTSTADLSLSQLNELITIYSARQTNQVSPLVRKLRSQALNTLTMMGILRNNNWDDVNEFLMDKRVCGRLMYELNEQELVLLNRKLHAIADKRKSDNNNYSLNN
ncbi:MAG: hypothetical protein Q8O72_10470 [Bacteroidales bacterium]|nr:hypothetical protein [Bacteroidales bacterium]